MIAVVDPWRFQPHPEVWVLVVGLGALALYVSRVIAPKIATDGPAITARQRRCFRAALVVLWLAADWPMHDIAEQYLYSAHMVQHLLITVVVPPLLLMSIPEWLARLVVGSGTRFARVLPYVTGAIVAGVVYNALVALTHWEAVVNLSADSAPFHYFMHVLLVSSSLLAWNLIVGPLPELRLSPPGQMIFLFTMTIIPTVPAGWLTFAEKPVYSTYDTAERLWGISVISDQQTAGAIMKVVAGLYLWVIITLLWSRWSAKQRGTDQRTIVSSQPLTYEQVTAAFEHAPAPAGDAPAAAT